MFSRDRRQNAWTSCPRGHEQYRTAHRGAGLSSGARRIAPHLQSARTSRTGRGAWGGFKLHAQCAQVGQLCAVRLMAARVDDRVRLKPLSEWLEDSLIVSDRGDISKDRAAELGRSRGRSAAVRNCKVE
jgi:hypothetical protein